MGKYNWEEIFTKLDSGHTYKSIMNEYGMAYATVIRKYNAFKQGEKKAMEENYEKEILENIAKKELRVLKEQKKNSYLKKEAHNLTRKEALVDLMFEKIGELDLKPIQQPKRTSVEKNTKEKDKTFIISDLHYINEEKSKSLNKIGKMLLSDYNNEKWVNIIFNGDFIENTHHLEQLINQGNPIEQTLMVSKILSEQLSYFYNNVCEETKITISFVEGNHDEIRQLGVKSGETKQINIVPIIKNNLELYLSEFDIEINDYKQEKYFEFFGKNIRHGHQLKTSEQKSVEKYIMNESIQSGKLFDTYIFSHFHQFRSWIIKGSKTQRNKGVMVIMTPSMKDWNGDFENKMNITNTSGIISIDEKRNVHYIEIPNE